MNFLTILLIIFVSFWLLGKILKIFLHVWVKKQTQRFQQYQSERQQASEPFNQSNGEVKIKTKGDAHTKKVSETVGEYIEFEEQTSQKES